ncbi:MAG: 50S ribosomal protein L3, large subunit ribosomal protein L3 [Candidatus Peregrinibacteria bacterium GW2011_GWE2_39_6]|nr:MAG: 50S ribosomal protein L3, large subunit ribosomal protein L3 [Candidatus Peregrinibacteria bacterium GW2011_GWF2_39_17]KKR26533.1 MAG: 50S ribosomal protein L3, large subunit ribosomal protein L3 [Candidatus Peregrinibacteria bacterium GW2011_GWE2_39_6]
MTGILGKKIGMTRLIQDDGRVIPLTVIECTPNIVTQIKTTEKDGYPALVLGFDSLPKKKKTQSFRYLREFKLIENENSTFNLNDKIKVDIFKNGDVVKVTGQSKGKGFAGVIKRHHFSSGPGAHGSHHHREPGSIGMCAKPGRVLKGKRMPGQMGNERVTLTNTQIAYVDPIKNLLGIKGSVPGANGSLIIIKKK